MRDFSEEDLMRIDSFWDNFCTKMLETAKPDEKSKRYREMAKMRKTKANPNKGKL